MAKIKTKIELTDKDILELVAEKYGLVLEESTIDIYKYDAENARETSFINVTVEGIQKQ